MIHFIDEDSSQLSLHLSTFCMAYGTELIALLPNATYLLQPKYVAAFYDLKTIWRQEVMNFQISSEGSQI